MFDHRRLPHRRVPVLVAVAAVLLSACGGGDDSSGAPVTAPAVGDAPTDEDTAPDANTDAAPDSTEILRAVLGAGSVIGGEIDVASTEGQPVVAWFWAPWCTICRAEGPTVADVAATYDGDVVLIGVPGRGADADMQRFIDDTGTRNITHVADFDGNIWSQFGVFAQPAFAFITADGDIDVFVGSLGEQGLVDRIEALIEV